MNCLILILLLGCCGGWGNSCCATRSGEICSGKSGRNFQGRKFPVEEPCSGRTNRMPEDCGCRQERFEAKNDACGCERDERESCDVGMIPPPWQEYPKFPHHHDDEGECES